MFITRGKNLSDLHLKFTSCLCHSSLLHLSLGALLCFALLLTLRLKVRGQSPSEAASIWRRGRGGRAFWRALHQCRPQLLTRLHQPKGSREVQSFHAPRRNRPRWGWPGHRGHWDSEWGGLEFLTNSKNDSTLLTKNPPSFNGILLLNRCDRVEQCFKKSDLKLAIILFYREMCLWDVSDGRCIEFTKLACTHTGIQVSISITVQVSTVFYRCTILRCFFKR